MKCSFYICWMFQIFFYFLLSESKILCYVLQCTTSRTQIQNVSICHASFDQFPVWIRRRVVSRSVRYTQLESTCRHCQACTQYGRFLFESRKNPDVSSDSDRIVAPACSESRIQLCDGCVRISET